MRIVQMTIGIMSCSSTRKKFELISKHRRQWIWRKQNRVYDPGNTKVYTRSQSIMVWGCFGANGTGDIVVIPTTMTGTVYRHILKKTSQVTG